MNDPVFDPICKFRRFLLKLIEDIKTSKENPDQCVFDFHVEHCSVYAFKKYIFTRKKDEAKIAFVIVYDTRDSELNYLKIDDNTLPFIFLNSDIIKKELFAICHMIDTIENENQLKKSLDLVMPRLEEFFE